MLKFIGQMHIVRLEQIERAAGLPRPSVRQEGCQTKIMIRSSPTPAQERNGDHKQHSDTHEQKQRAAPQAKHKVHPLIPVFRTMPGRFASKHFNVMHAGGLCNKGRVGSGPMDGPQMCKGEEWI